MYNKEYYNQVYNELKNLSHDEIKAYANMADHILAEEYAEKCLQNMEEHDQTLSGKTYRRVFSSPWGMVNEVHYYKVVSGYSNNDSRATCLVFDEIPFAECQEEISARSFKWNFSYLDVTDVMIDTLNEEHGFKEITDEEWEEAFDKYCEGVKKLEWKKEC